MFLVIYLPKDEQRGNPCGDPIPQSRQSARLFLQSSELGPADKCAPRFRGGGDTLACGKGGGGSQFGRGDRHYGTLGIYVLCAPSCKMCMYMHVQTVEVLYSKNIENEYWKINLYTARYYGCNQHRVFLRKNRHFRYSEYSILYFLLNMPSFLRRSSLFYFYFHFSFYIFNHFCNFDSLF